MVVRSRADYLRVLQRLLPPGRALTRDPEANLTKLLRAFAGMLARVDLAVAGLYDEADPRTTSQLLADWERVAGLPDPAIGSAQQSLVERRAWLTMRLTSIGGQSAAYFIALAAQLGTTITIERFRPWCCGDGETGREQLSGDGSVRFLWRVNMPSEPVYLFQVGASQIGDPLGYVRTGVIEPLLRRYQPAYGTLIFNYGSS